MGARQTLLGQTRTCRARRPGSRFRLQAKGAVPGGGGLRLPLAWRAAALRDTASVSKGKRFAAKATAPALAERCLRTLREWSRLQGDTSRLATWRANRLADAQRVYLQTLSTTPDGRRHVEGFLDDDEPGVREWAAAQVLFWNEPEARRVLQHLSSSETFPFNFNAEMTLREFDAGRLRL
jgi:hypothetical protein